MSKNGNGYVQVFKDPDGEPMVVLRAEDFFELVQTVQSVRQEPRKGTSFPPSSAAFEAFLLAAKNVKKDYRLAEFRGFAEDTEPHIRAFPEEVDEDAADASAFTNTKIALEHGEEERVPGDVAARLLSGESPLKIWRQHRGLTQNDLAGMADRKQSTISGIETGKNKGVVETLRALADALKVQIDDLVL